MRSERFYQRFCLQHQVHRRGVVRTSAYRELTRSASHYESMHYKHSKRLLCESETGRKLKVNICIHCHSQVLNPPKRYLTEKEAIYRGKDSQPKRLSSLASNSRVFNRSSHRCVSSWLTLFLPVPKLQKHHQRAQEHAQNAVDRKVKNP